MGPRIGQGGQEPTVILHCDFGEGVGEDLGYAGLFFGGDGAVLGFDFAVHGKGYSWFPVG